MSTQNTTPTEAAMKALADQLAKDHLDALGTLWSESEHRRLSAAIFTKAANHFAPILAERDSLRTELEQARNYAFCVHCGTKTAKVMADLVAHMLTCEKHPMRKLEAELTKRDEAGRKAYTCLSQWIKGGRNHPTSDTSAALASAPSEWKEKA